MTLLINARVVTPEVVLDRGWIRLSGSRIAAVGTARVPEPIDGGAPHADVIDLDGAWVLPGFIDLHNHGGGGFAFNTSDPADVVAAADYHRRHGTTSLLASVVTTTPDKTCSALSAIATAMAKRPVGAAAILGAHLEGPFINADRPGCHELSLLLNPDVGVYHQFQEATAASIVQMVTVATELPGAGALVEAITAGGAIAALGHSTASYEQARAAFAAGVRVVTHLFNAMPSLNHRAPGIIGAAFDDSETILELIADGVHVHDELIRLTFTAAPGRVALVTDAVAAAGLPPGSHSHVGPVPVLVKADSVTKLNGTTLAGSTLTMDQAVRRSIAAGLPIVRVAEAASTTPARALGIGERTGSIEAGKAADLVVMDSNLAVVQVVVGGQISPDWAEQQVKVGI